MVNPEKRFRYGAIVLAAGASTRLGQPKQLLPFRGQSLLRRAAAGAVEAVGEGPVAVVLGAYAERMHAELEGLPVLPVVNPKWAAGMGASVRIGMEALLQVQPQLAGVLLLLCDQPHVQAATLRTLLETHERTGRAVVASSYGEVLGVPAFFQQRLFPQLLALQGQEGARKIIAAQAETVEVVSFPAGIIDIDTPADYERLSAREDPTQTPGGEAD